MNESDPQLEVEFVFGHLDSHLKKDLQSFWKEHQQAYQQELKAHVLKNSSSQTGAMIVTPLRRQPGAIARDRSGKIVGVVFVVLRELDASLKLGGHAYFQRMYICESCRGYQPTNQLFQSFVQGFAAATDLRDHRASCLMSENMNPRLRNTFIRKYFAKLGFRMLGSNDIDSEIWYLPLKTNYTL